MVFRVWWVINVWSGEHPMLSASVAGVTRRICLPGRTGGRDAAGPDPGSLIQQTPRLSLSNRPARHAAYCILTNLSLPSQVTLTNNPAAVEVTH